MSNDKRTIGVTAPNERVLTALQESGPFASEIEAARFAFAVAVRKGADATPIDGTNTKWNVGTLDADQSLRHLVDALYPGTVEPYRLIEILINRGLVMLDAGDNVPPDVFAELFSGTGG
ncbi:MAG: hypothetical protein JNL14_19550 [Devosia sp.]|uniref:hypothetical protein n=1 Tax=Devosia sp. TaxID=1871048 RepID=UPI001A4236BE|nr:hypothetical protein [Devosia sp.]MBL8599938.1 hypothetical protein [Devosia sp.]